jgi:hypothetical protein
MPRFFYVYYRYPKTVDYTSVQVLRDITVSLEGFDPYLVKINNPHLVSCQCDKREAEQG